jgi:hypothetical protein
MLHALKKCLHALEQHHKMILERFETKWAASADG